MRHLLAVVLVVGALGLYGCGAIFPYQSGVVYTDYQIPAMTTENETGTKQGEACQTNILGLVATGDASISTAAENGGITNIYAVDTNFSTILGIYSKSCTLVTGT